jgi:KaiC/GvpD/RAD55 family RecA-like ATPase
VTAVVNVKELPKRNGIAAAPANDIKPPRVWTPAEIIADWTREGPLEHEPTGIAKLDELTGGGLTYGCRAYVVGAPNAWKTGLVVQLADHWVRNGLAVGMLMIDEEPGDGLARFAQRAGWHRRHTEERNPEVLAEMTKALGPLPIRFYGADHTIESAAADLAEFARSLQAGAAFVIDSIQTARCDSEADDDSTYRAVTKRVQAVRAVTTRHRFITVATSEMGRAGYRNAEAAENANDMALAKESGAIEYSARVMLSLRSVPNESNLVEVRVAKNKLGPSGDRIYLETDRGKQRLTETEAPSGVDVAVQRAEKAHGKVVADAACYVEAVVASPGIVVRHLYATLIARHGSFSRDRADAARARLGAAVVVQPGARRAEHLYIDGSRLPDEVVAAMPPEARAAAVGSRAPEATS